MQLLAAVQFVISDSAAQCSQHVLQFVQVLLYVRSLVVINGFIAGHNCSKSIHVSIVADRRRQSTTTSDVIKWFQDQVATDLLVSLRPLGFSKEKTKRFVLYSQYRERSDRQSIATGALGKVCS